MRRLAAAIARIVGLAAVVILVAALVLRQPTFAAIDAHPALRADASTLRSHVEFLTTTAHPRIAERTDKLDIAARYIAARFQDSRAWLVEEQTFAARKRTYRNVIAHYGPRDTSAPAWIVGAHYDAYGAKGDLPGADDNASGTAGLLELARLLGQHPPAVPVLLVAFANEEPPFFASAEMGSAVHASSLATSGRPVAAMISLEMIGYFGGEQHWDSSLLGFLYPDEGDFIGVAGGWEDRQLARHVKRALAAAGIPALSFTGPRSMLDASDQRNYWSRGWRAVMVTDTAYLRNPHYHTAGDTAETLDYETMARVVDGVFSAVRRGEAMR